MAMVALRRLFSSTSLFRIHPNTFATTRTTITSPRSHALFKTSYVSYHPRLLLLPLPLHFSKISAASTFQLFNRYNSFSTATASTDNLSDNGENTIASHPWPEWVTFIDRLKSKGYFDESMSLVEDAEAVVGDADATTGANRMDLNQLKNACISFARERFDILKSLSREDIQVLVECGCPNLFRKAVNSAKRLRAFVRLDEGEVCSACNLRGSCDRAYVLLKESEAAARTVDIVRILLIYALDPTVLSGGEKLADRALVEASARNLLSELIELSETSPDPALPKHVVKPPNQKQQSQKFMGHEQSQNAEMKRGDWICPKCNFMNFARNIRCLECKEDGPKRTSMEDVEMKKGDWTCPQCQFMNFARNLKCLRCYESRPKRQLNEGEWECPSCDFLNYRRNMACLKCNHERPKNEEAQYEEHIWRRPH